MIILKSIQWFLGIVMIFYLYKALLGHIHHGDGWRAGMVAITWLLLATITSGFLELG
ncbi:hypothetical protein [Guyparkeria sp. TX1]|uniref:hypothetical protein n=1 Tax=Guyparkeria sp. TX1 TaxID=3115001 RepID=UPI00397767BC